MSHKILFWKGVSSMDNKSLKSMTYDELRTQYLQFLLRQGIGKNTINTAYTDTFYLWRKNGRELFWKAVESKDSDAREMILGVLKDNSSGDPDKLVSGYLSHLRRFRSFLITTDKYGEEKEVLSAQKPDAVTHREKSEIDIPKPTNEQVDYYLKKWNSLENYQLQENALDKLFFSLCPNNTDISDILLKVSTLNDFYSTNIFSVYPVAKQILSLNIDERLNAKDVTLVEDIKRVSINGQEHNFYSFASKYCSHHKPLAYPIYDSYVDRVLRYFRDRDAFSTFAGENLKNYILFKDILIAFQKYYGLETYNLKLIDKYLWLLGKDYFPKKYGKN